MKKLLFGISVVLVLAGCKEKKCTYTGVADKVFASEIKVISSGKVIYEGHFSGFPFQTQLEHRGEMFLLNIQQGIVIINKSNNKELIVYCEEENASRKYYNGEYEVINFDALSK